MIDAELSENDRRLVDMVTAGTTDKNRDQLAAIYRESLCRALVRRTELLNTLRGVERVIALRRAALAELGQDETADDGDGNPTVGVRNG